MNGIHDMGGMHGFGAIEVIEGEQLFDAEWQRRTFGLASVTDVREFHNVDRFRHAIERIPVSLYFAEGYYGRWLMALLLLALESDALSDDLLRKFDRAREPTADRLPTPGPVGQGAVREIEGDPKFAVGSRVRTRNAHPRGHTRLPGYARGCVGRVVEVHPAMVFPDTHAHGGGECPQYLYSVEFDGRELWGDDAEARTSVSVDLFEPYLTVAEG